jgi:AcrR family transcriptional regulator
VGARANKAGATLDVTVPADYITDWLVSNIFMSTKPIPRWSRRKDARPAELTKAALALFVERGYAATRLEDVAQRAGVSKGTLYLYFESKEELFKAVVREGLVPVLEQGERMLSEHQGDSASLIRALALGWWEMVGNTPFGGIPKLMFAECRNFPELGKFYYDEVISRGHRLIQEAVRRGMQSAEFRPLDLDYVTQLIIAPLVLQAIWRHSFDFCDTHRLDPTKYVEQHVDLLLVGLRSAGKKRSPRYPKKVSQRAPRRGARQATLRVTREDQ